MFSIKTSLRLLAIVMPLLATVAWAGEAWLRIDQPGASMRADLPPQAIDYGHFIWMPESALHVPAAESDHRRYDEPFELTIDQQRFDPVAGFPDLDLAPEWLEPARSEHGDFHLVQFQGPVKAQWLDELRSEGLEPVQYLAPFAYIVWSQAAALDRSRAHRRVRFAGDFPPVMRVPAQSRNTHENHQHTMAMIYRHESSRVLDTLSQLGVPVVSATAAGRDFSVIHLDATPDRYLELARIPGVLTVQQIGQDGGARGEMSNQSIVGNADAGNILSPGYLEWLAEAGLDGSDVTVGVIDGGIRETHSDLVGRLISCQSADGNLTSCTSANSTHGTHVASAIAGTGQSAITDALGFLRGLGAAPGAWLVEQRYDPFLNEQEPGGMVPDGMLTIFHESALSGAEIANNSWGPSGTPKGYDIPTRQVDVITRDADPDQPGQQPVLPVWAIMNGHGDRTGECAPSSLGSPDEAKNLIAVGSTAMQSLNGEPANDLLDLSFNSAHGPACDGRRVPHLVAPGCRADGASANSDTSFLLLCGTSMAAPVVAGAIAIFFEQYRNQFGTHPSPALTKAVFAGAARNLVGQLDADLAMLGHRPDRKQGWGRVDLDAVINRTNHLSMLDQHVTFTATGQSWSGTFTPHRANEPVQVMLAWTDAPGPGTGGTTPAWVNDLDLIVTVNGEEYLGNNIDPDTGFSRVPGLPDHRNNLEGIVLDATQHQGGEINITILAANLAADAIDPWNPGSPRQDFALAAFNLGAPGEPVALQFVSQPAEIEPDELLPEITLELVDAYNQRVTAHSPWEVDMLLRDCGSSHRPDGTTPSPLESGLAEFADLTTSREGWFRLQASISGFEFQAISDPFRVSIPRVHHDRFEQSCIP